MPRQSKTGHQGVPWGRCDRCKTDRPLSEFQTQNGLLLDDQCYDNPEQMLREEIIAEALSAPINEAENETQRIRQDPNYVRLGG